MKKILFALFTIFSLSFAGNGSLYSKYGVGEINIFGGDRSVGMGNTGIAVFGETNISLQNPAALGNISRTLFSGSYQHKTFRIANSSGSTLFNSANIQSAVVAFPLYKPAKSVLAVALLPYSTVGYNLTTKSVLNGNEITQSFDGKGGLTSAQISLSYKVASDIVLGATGHYLFGTLYNDQTLSFKDPSFFGGSYQQRSSMSGVGLTLGGIVSGIDQLLNISDSKHLSFGATLFTGSSLTLEEETVRSFSSNLDTLSSIGKTVKIPFGFSSGFAYLNKGILFTADVHFQNWSNFKITGKTPNSMQNSFRAGLGIELLPTTEYTESFWDRVSYRAGGYFGTTNVKINGTSINEMFGSVGLGFPASSESRVNLGLEYGIRGTTSSSLLKDTIIRFTAAVTISEIMFHPPEID